MGKRFWSWWIGVNLALAILLPFAFSQWLLHWLAEQRRLYPDDATTADSPGIPIGAFTELLWEVQVAITCLAVIWHLILVHRRRATPRTTS